VQLRQLFGVQVPEGLLARLASGPPRALQQLLAVLRQVDRPLAAVARMSAALRQACALERVDRLHHRARVHPRRLDQLLLRRAGTLRQHRHHRKLVEAQVELRERGDERLARAGTHPIQEKPWITAQRFWWSVAEDHRSHESYELQIICDTND